MAMLVLISLTGCQITGGKQVETGANFEPTKCNAGKYTMCWVKNEKVVELKSGLDHVDSLGYSGAAFRIQTLPRQVICPSTVSARYGYKPGVIKGKSDLTETIKLAIKLVEPGQFGEYVSGNTAFNDWIKLLEADEKSEYFKKQEKAHSQDSGLKIMNHYCFSALKHARECTGPFLRRRAEESAGKRREMLVKAAECYEQEAKLLQSVKLQWTPEARKKEAEVLKKCQALEKQAAEYLKAAL